MFLSFQSSPTILRFFGKGKILEPGAVGWNEIVNDIDTHGSVTAAFHASGSSAEQIKLRNIVVVDIYRIRDSCGFGVPLFEYQGERSIFPERFQNWEVRTFEERRATVNRESIDHLPGLPRLNASSSAPSSISSAFAPTTGSSSASLPHHHPTASDSISLPLSASSFNPTTTIKLQYFSLGLVAGIVAFLSAQILSRSR